ncbi:hypothetical protein EXIGLDRAFT_721807 [Exidia glandulosa HHB12029]|uniref:F-box domain-containing protein n=1 Tax=Exidia glandulosa HHB12029 TaxID=1314781 RepID=A0A165QHD8_EXIGL|nr:hypothetical protein EXIGLDRAFT_721807 [Exidia glandulosa HHB12029]
MGGLPDELVLQIFDLIFVPEVPTADPYWVLYEPIKTCSLVCRQWHDCAQSYLWRNTNFLCQGDDDGGRDCQERFPRLGMALMCETRPLASLITTMSVEVGTQYSSQNGYLSGAFTERKHVDPLQFAQVVSLCVRLSRLHITAHHELSPTADGFDSECLVLLRRAARLEHLSLDDRHNGNGVTAQLLGTWRRLRTLRVRMLRFSTRAVPGYMALEALHLERAPSPAFVSYLLYSHSIIKTMTLELLDDYTQCFLTFRASLRELMVRRHREFEEDSPARSTYLDNLQLAKLERLRVFVIDQLKDPGLLDVLPTSIDTFGFNPVHTEDTEPVLEYLRKRSNVRTVMMPWHTRDMENVVPVVDYCQTHNLRVHFTTLVIWEVTNWNRAIESALDSSSESEAF